MASDKEKDRSLDGRSQETNRSRDAGGTNTAGARSDKEVDRSLSRGGMGGGLNRSAGDRESTAASREASYSGRGGMNSPGEGMRSSGSSVAGREVGDVGGMARSVGEVGNGLRGGMAMERATDLASARRASENASMDALGRMRTADLASTHRASEDASMAGYYAAQDAALSRIRKAEAGVTNPYNTISGGATADVTNMTIQDAIDFAKTKWSGKIANVLGGFQFKDATLAGIAKRMGYDPTTTRMTPAVQDKLALGLMQQRADAATVNGKVDVDKFAAGLAQEWASLANSSGLSHWAANGIDKASVSYGDVRQMAKDLVDTGVVGPRNARSYESIATAPAAQTASVRARTGTEPGVASLPAEVASVPTSRPSDFATKYLGSTPEDVAAVEYRNYARERVLGPRDPVQHTPQEARAEWNDFQESLTRDDPPQIASSGPAPDTAPPVAPDKVAAAQPETVPPANAPENVPPTNASVTVAPEIVEAPKGRTTGQQVAATGLDIGMGMIPGIGMGLSLVNGGLMLTGNRTLGERVIDAIGTGDGTGFNPAEGDPNRREYRERKEPKTTIAANPKRFEEKYLAFVDTTKRPTPAEKWGTGTSNYGDREYG